MDLVFHLNPSEDITLSIILRPPPWTYERGKVIIKTSEFMVPHRRIELRIDPYHGSVMPFN